MQDRFKFRAERSDNGEWVIGGLCEIPPPPQCIGEISPSKFCIFCEHPNTLTDWGMPRQMCLIDVDPDTVGQCTGLHAAKSYRGESEDDRLIFEGDVLSQKTTPKFKEVNPSQWERIYLVRFGYYDFEEEGLSGRDTIGFYLSDVDENILRKGIGSIESDNSIGYYPYEIIGTIHDRNEGEG